jgi:hypothetical protein
LKLLNFIDVSGVGNSGKTAVCDVLREVQGVSVPPYWFEFDFIRIQNGLLDLRHRLLEGWSPVRSHYAIQAFRRVAEQMGSDPAWWDLPGLFHSSSQRYDRHFRGEFVRLSKIFADSFVPIRYVAEWPYDDLQLSGGRRFLRKVAIKMGGRKYLRREVLLPSGQDFDARATAYLNALFANRTAPGDSHVVLNNGLEPFNPVPGLDMIGGARQIVVTRDPRDVYVSGLNRHKMAQVDKRLLPFDNDGLNKSFLATDNLSEFVARQRLFYGHVYKGGDSRILKVRFEDLCLHYEEIRDKILRFLDIDPARHIRPRSSFIPEKSRSGVGAWRRYSRQDEVDFIARELPHLIYEERTQGGGAHMGVSARPS